MSKKFVALMNPEEKRVRNFKIIPKNFVTTPMMSMEKTRALPYVNLPKSKKLTV